MPFSEITTRRSVKIVQKYFSDTQWSEVILALFQLTTRTSDIEKLVEAINKGISSVLEKHSAEELLSEVTFTDLNCPSKLSTSLANKCFEQIEESSWMPHRQRLLENALKGLRSAKTRELVKGRLVRWFPERIWEYQDIFSVMKNWPKCPEVIECLFKGFHSEHPTNQISSAISLATVAGGDPEIGERIVKLARNAIDPIIRAAALQALTIGWPSHDALTKIVEDAYKSISPELKFAAFFSIIKQGKQTDSDLQNLLQFAPIHKIYGMWDYDMVSLILKGWPKSEEVKTKCLSSLNSATEMD